MLLLVWSVMSALEEDGVFCGGCVSYTKNFVPRKFDLREKETFSKRIYKK